MGKVFSKCVSSNHSSTDKLDKIPSESDDKTTTPIPNESAAEEFPNQDTPREEQTEIDRRLTQPLRYDYDMYHTKRGVAFIFNHEKFDDSNLGRRYGTEVDAENLKKTFENLGFEVRLFNDQSVLEMRDILRKYAADDHSDEDCVVVAIMSHGELDNFVDKKTGESHHSILSHDQYSYIHARDDLYPLQWIFKYFTDERCPTLRDKPRIFFIQACQGDKLDAGIKLVLNRKKRSETDGIGIQELGMSPVLPHKDFLIAYSTLPGYYSFRNSSSGAWFIRELCKELNSNDGFRNLMSMLTYVMQTIAFDYESQNADNRNYDKKKQIPCIVSMLTKLVFFPKPISQTDESP